jgi:hypothetical protein
LYLAFQVVGEELAELAEEYFGFVLQHVYLLHIHMQYTKFFKIQLIRICLLWFLGLTLAFRVFEQMLFHKIPRPAKVALTLIALNHIFVNQETYQLHPGCD